MREQTEAALPPHYDHSAKKPNPRKQLIRYVFCGNLSLLSQNGLLDHNKRCRPRTAYPQSIVVADAHCLPSFLLDKKKEAGGASMTSTSCRKDFQIPDLSKARLSKTFPERPVGVFSKQDMRRCLEILCRLFFFLFFFSYSSMRSSFLPREMSVMDDKGLNACSAMWRGKGAAGAVED